MSLYKRVAHPGYSYLLSNNLSAFLYHYNQYPQWTNFPVSPTSLEVTRAKNTLTRVRFSVYNLAHRTPKLTTPGIHAAEDKIGGGKGDSAKKVTDTGREQWEKAGYEFRTSNEMERCR